MQKTKPSYVEKRTQFHGTYYIKKNRPTCTRTFCVVEKFHPFPFNFEQMLNQIYTNRRHATDQEEHVSK